MKNRNIIKKLTAVILSLLMVAAVLPTMLTAAESTERVVSGNLTWTLDRSDMTLTISGEGMMEDYLEGRIPNPFFGDRADITTVIIEQGVTSIGKYAFQNYERLSDIQMPETLTTIGFGAFENTPSLELIEFPASLKSISDIFLMSEPADIMIFKGNVPELTEWSGFYREDNNTDPYLTRIFYMENDLTWTDEAKAAFGEGVLWNDEADIGDSPTLDNAADDSFKDVKSNAWYADAVKYVCAKDMMDGFSATEFRPLENLTRAQMVQILFNISGEDKNDYLGKTAYTDVKQSAWYAPAVNWAHENSITKGVSEDKFAPNREITRQELARFLFVYANHIDYYYTIDRADLTDPADRYFVDADSIADWAYDAVSWAVAAGIINGMTADTIQPRANTNRAMTAQMLMQFDKYIEENERITTGAFAILADYIIKNGVYGGGYWPNTYVYYIESGEKRFTAEYYPSSEVIQLYYCNGIYDSIVMTGNHAMCIEEICMSITGLTDSYYYYYYYDAYNELNGISIYSNGRMYDGYYTETELDYYRYPDLKTEDDALFAKEMKEMAMAELNRFIDILIQDCGLEYNDLFITK